MRTLLAILISLPAAAQQLGINPDTGLLDIRGSATSGDVTGITTTAGGIVCTSATGPVPDCGIDTATIPTRISIQSGTDTSCVPTSASATAYTCDMTGNPLTTYTTNAGAFKFTPDVTSSGSPTLNINTLGVRNLKEDDDSTPGTFVAGRTYWLVPSASNIKKISGGKTKAPWVHQIPAGSITTSNTLGLAAGTLLPVTTGASLFAVNTALDPKTVGIAFTDTAATYQMTHQFSFPEDWDGSIPTLTLYGYANNTLGIIMKGRLKCQVLGTDNPTTFAWAAETFYSSASTVPAGANIAVSIPITITAITNCAAGRVAYLGLERDTADANTASFVLLHARLRSYVTLQ